MKPTLRIVPILSRLSLAVMLAASCFPAHAQSYAISWHKIAGGGGSSSGGLYQVTGAIGQPDASAALSGGGYSVTGGFWSVFSAVPTPGLPTLIIMPISANSAKILWAAPAANSYTLQQTPSLASPSWTTSDSAITSANGTNSVTIVTASASLFFRLKQ